MSSPAVYLHDPGQLAPPQESRSDFVDPLIPAIQVDFLTYWNQQVDEIQAEGGAVTHSPHVAFRREMRFVNLLANGVLRVHEREPYLKKTVMMDMDETTGNMRDSIGERIIRPGFGIIVGALQEEMGDWLEVGALTTVRQHYLDTVLGKQLRKKSAAVNLGMLISSKDSKIAQDPEILALDDYDDHTEQYTALAHMLDGAKVKASRPAYPKDWYDRKLSILNHLMQGTEGLFRSFIYVDDLPAANVIDPNHSQVHGLYVKPSMRFHLPDGLAGLGYAF